MKINSYLLCCLVAAAALPQIVKLAVAADGPVIVVSVNPNNSTSFNASKQALSDLVNRLNSRNNQSDGNTTTTRVMATTVRAVTAAGTTTLAARTTAAAGTTAKPAAGVTTAAAGTTTAKAGATTAKAGGTTVAGTTTAKARVINALAPMDGGNGTKGSSYVSEEVNQTAVVFDCRRYQHDCNFTGGICNMDTGKCDCMTGYAGYDCSVSASSVRPSSQCNAGAGCGANGTQNLCVAAGKSAACACDYAVGGDSCDQNPINLTCSDTSISLEVKPYPSFAAFEGLLYMLNMSMDTMIEASSCRFEQSAGAYRFQSTFDNLVANCGGTKLADKTFAAKFVVQSDPHWLTPFDQVFNVKCISTTLQSYEKAIIVSVQGSAVSRGLSQGVLDVSNSLDNLRLNNLIGEHRKIEPYQMPTLVLSVNRIVVDKKSHNYSIAPVSEPLRIGDPVQITVTNLNSSIYTALRTEDCMIKMDNSIEMKLITKSCPASKFAWSLLRWDRTIVTNSSLAYWLIIPANALGGQSRYVDIYCRVKVCATEARQDCNIDKSGCNSAQMYPPNYNVANYGRRRRRAADDDGDEISLDDMFSPQPYVYTTVHSRFQLIVDDEEDVVSDAGSRSPSASQSSTSSASTSLSSLSLLTLLTATCSYYFLNI